jgi:hypothetical protein
MFARMSAHWAPLSIFMAIALLIGSFETKAEVALDSTTKQSLFEAISGYEVPAGDTLTPIFKELGFSPKSPVLWRSFPAARKLATLYSSAEAGAPGDGKRALAAVADKMSSRFDSLRNNRAIGDLVKGQDLSRPFKFNAEIRPTLALVPTEGSWHHSNTLSLC